ncbi:unnamed protein product [Urochloa humidicola]
MNLILPESYVKSFGRFFTAQSRVWWKMIVCSSDLVAAIFYDRDVGFYREGDPSWLVRTNYRREGQYEDIVFHHDKLYALTTKEELFAFDAGDSEASNVEHAIRAVQPSPAMWPSIIKRYLVTSCGKLLMVKLIDHDRSGNTKNIGVKVFEAELATSRWVEVKKLDGGQALFVSRGCSKAIPMSGHERGFQGNRVYFLAFEFVYSCSEVNLADVPNYCFYDMGTGTNTAVFLNRGGAKRHWKLHRAEWFFPSM